MSCRENRRSASTPADRHPVSRHPHTSRRALAARIATSLALAVAPSAGAASAIGRGVDAAGGSSVDGAVSLSPNWSGYVARGGAFSAVEGTFTVPTVYAASQATSTTEWVGVDGVGAHRPLIQAGVEEDYDHDSNLVGTYAWWEILPAGQTRIPVSVTSGDRITVAISALGDGRWRIGLTNDTTGVRFATDQPYAGPGDSVKWIVEAPASNGAAQETLGHFTPEVAFTDLKLAGRQTGLTQVRMIQDGVAVSTPSPLIHDAFAVSYGSRVPSPP